MGYLVSSGRLALGPFECSACNRRTFEVATGVATMEMCTKTIQHQSSLQNDGSFTTRPRGFDVQTSPNSRVVGEAWLNIQTKWLGRSWSLGSVGILLRASSMDSGRAIWFALGWRCWMLLRPSCSIVVVVVLPKRFVSGFGFLCSLFV